MTQKKEYNKTFLFFLQFLKSQGSIKLGGRQAHYILKKQVKIYYQIILAVCARKQLLETFQHHCCLITQKNIVIKV